MATDAAHSVKEQAQETGAELKDKATEASHRLKKRGASYINERKERVADRVRVYGAAAHEAANKLKEEHDDTLAEYAELMADRVDHVSEYLRQSSLDDLMQDTEGFVRDRQEWVCGGLFLAGLAVGRFLKASRPSPSEGRDTMYGESETEGADEAAHAVAGETATGPVMGPPVGPI